jgi:hypothetical protein
VVYVALDNHKYGDFSPYLYKSINKGKTWKSIKGNLPDKTLVWRLVQDHIKKELLFAATEFGIYFSLDAGNKWIKMAGTPTISFRDLAIQKRENDLVGASFGRGFYVFDDYSVLRELTPETLKQEAALFSTRKAWWYVPRTVYRDNGADLYSAKNPDFGAVFTYYLSKTYPSLKADRQEKEKALNAQGKDIEFPGWEVLEAEKNQAASVIWLTVKDDEGNVIRKLKAPAKKGINRIAWDLRFANSRPINPDQADRGGRWNRRGAMVVPGMYSVSMSKEIDGSVTELAEPVSFDVVPLRESTLKGASKEEYKAFMADLNSLQADYAKVGNDMEKNLSKVKAMQLALERTAIEPGELNAKLHDLHQALLALDVEENGMSTKREVGEKNNPGVGTFLRTASRGLATTYGPTQMYKENLETAKKLLVELKAKVDMFTLETIPALEKQLEVAGAPMIL